MRRLGPLLHRSKGESGQQTQQNCIAALTCQTQVTAAATYQGWERACRVVPGAVEDRVDNIKATNTKHNSEKAANEAGNLVERPSCTPP